VLKGLGDLFGKAFAGDGAGGAESREHAVRVATALLLIEVARADYDEALKEDEAVAELLRDFFELSEEEVSVLMDEARAESDYAVSLQAFTRQLHENLTVEEKHRVVEMLWRVALADRRLDKYEDYLVRKVADLLYVSHGDLIRIRNEVKRSLGL
jgi:uncharacterized tellurite resistance protein B-like protein